MTVAFVDDVDFTLHAGDCLDVLRDLPAESVHCVVTSPPYWGLRDYGVAGQLGLEPTPELYVARMVEVFREVRRVLRSDGTCWLNLGDSYASNGTEKGSGNATETRDVGMHGAFKVTPSSLRDRAAKLPNQRPVGLKPKDLVGIPWRVAFALQADGWYLRSDIVWSKPNPMPESVTDRPTKAHEYVFLLTKSARYFFDQEAVREPSEFRKPWLQSTPDVPERSVSGTFAGYHPNGRNVRSVWEIATQPYAEAHFATYPQELVRRCLLAGCPEGGTVLDPFLGSGTTAFVARKHGRLCIGIELNPEYARLAADRLSQLSLLAEGAA